MGQVSRIGILTVALTLFASLALAGETARIRGSHVNLRLSPTGDVIHQFAGGEQLDVLERDGDRCHVSAPDLQLDGWVYGDFVQTDEASTDGSPLVAQLPVDDMQADDNAKASVATGRGGAQSPPARSQAKSTIPVNSGGRQGGPPAGITDSPKVTEVVVAGQCIDPTSGNAAKPAVTKPKVAARPKAPNSKKVAANFKAVNLTSPAKLGSADYHSVAGPALASISADNVNLRESPSLKAKVVGSVTSGDHVYVVTNNDPWYLVSLPDKKLKGWVFGEYVDVQPRVAIKADNVRLRESPKLDARVKDQLAKGDVLYKVNAKDGWVQVASSASGMSGWVKAEYVVHSTDSVSRPFHVTGDQVNFRASPAVDADVIGKLPAGVTVNVLGRNDKWAYAYFEGHKGWLYTEYLDGGAGVSPVTGQRSALSPATRTLSWKQVGGASIGNRLIERARAMMGTPYVWGGESDDGVDCSGFIFKLLCDEGCDGKCLPRRASEQMAQLGLEVDKEDLQPGDLVFFHTYKEGASHVGIYLGDGDFIHASSAQAKVTVSNLSERYYRDRFVGARRITEEELKGLK